MERVNVDADLHPGRDPGLISEKLKTKTIQSPRIPGLDQHLETVLIAKFRERRLARTQNF